MLDDAYHMDKPKFRAFLLGKPKLYIFQFLKRVANFESAESPPPIPESDIDHFIESALRELDLFQQQLADTTEMDKRTASMIWINEQRPTTIVQNK
jgi:hypothetical protein